MTEQIAALDALIEAVEAGKPMPHLALARFPREMWEWIVKANSGKLDAAHALHEALLPGWVLQSDTLGDAWIYIPTRNAPPIKQFSASNAIQARAELICILKAYRAGL